MTAQVQWLAKGNIGVTDYTMDGYGMKIGGKVGIGIEKEVWSKSFYQILLMVSKKGTSDGFTSIDQVYLEVPIQWGMNVARVSDYTDLYVTGGMYVALGIAGNSKDDEYSGPTFTHRNIWGEGLSRFDFGFITGLGFDFGRVRAGVEFELGLYPLLDYGGSYWEDDYGYEYYEADPAPLNYGISLTLTYKF